LKNFAKNILASSCSPLLSKIHQLKDSHKGEKCYLFGDGVSIKWFDLSAFSDALSIPCSYMPFHKDFSKLNVDHFLLIEPWLFYPYHWTTSPPKRLLRNNLQKLYKKNVLDVYSDKNFIFNLSNYPVVHGRNVFFTFQELKDSRLPDNFITKRIDCFADSLRASILLAIYLGFDRCHLVGFDYTHLPSRSRHWYEKGTGVISNLSNYSKEFFEIAKEFIDITTITLDGKSEHINAVTYADFSGMEPEFRENTEIADSMYLDEFSQWPGFKIY
jgi:hypothetical protein